MRFWKWTIGVMIAVLVVGCATYPVGYWVDPELDQRVEDDLKSFYDQRFEGGLLYCDKQARKDASLIVPMTTHIRPANELEVIIYLGLLPLLISNDQRWANVYTNTIKACMEDRGGYRWVNDPKGEQIQYMKAKIFAPSQIDDGLSKEHP